MVVELVRVPQLSVSQLPILSSTVRPNGRQGQANKNGLEPGYSLVKGFQVDLEAELEQLARLREEHQELMALHMIGLALSSCLSLKEVVKTLYRESNRLLDTTNFALATYSPGNDVLSFKLIVSGGRRLKPRAIRAADHSELHRLVSQQASLLINEPLNYQFDDHRGA